jgi:hypothetical protein
MDNRPQVIDEADTPWTVALLAMVLAWSVVGCSAIFQVALLTRWP